MNSILKLIIRAFVMKLGYKESFDIFVVFFYVKTTSDQKSEVKDATLEFYFTPKSFFKFKINAFKKESYKKV